MSVLPSPTGPCPIGTLTRHWVDHDRRAIFAGPGAGPRELMAQLWYPARPDSGAPRAAYVDDPRTLEQLALLMELPRSAFAGTGSIRTHAVRDAPVAKEQEAYPVLVFSHGRCEVCEHNTFQVEELASHGCVVVTIDDPSAASGVRFPDGRLVEFEDDTTRMRIRETLSRWFSNDYRIVEVKASSDVIDEVSRIRDAEVALVIAEQQLKASPEGAPGDGRGPAEDARRPGGGCDGPTFTSDSEWRPARSTCSTHLQTGATVRGPAWVHEVCDFQTVPVFVRPGPVLPIGARGDRPDYPYDEDVTLRAYEFADGGRTTVAAPGTTREVSGDLRGGPRRWHSDGRAAARHRGMAAAPHGRASRDQCGRGGPVSSPNGTEISVPADIGRCSIEL
jgi:Platelet-activating factor acetylhydrolase, isoform II